MNNHFDGILLNPSVLTSVINTLADLLIDQGNPLEDLDQVIKYQDHLQLIVKNGAVSLNNLEQ